MSSKIYQIELNNLNESDDLSHPIFEDFSNLLNVESENFIGFSGGNILFVNLSETELKLFLYILEKNDIDFTLKDVSWEVIRGDIQREHPEVENLSPGIFTDFRYNNTSVDDILDKINERGIESIDDIDKYILNANR